MTTQLLIYENVVPVSQTRHGNWSVQLGTDYAFSRSVNAVPLRAVEFLAAAAEYPIVFTGTDEAVLPAAVLGLRGKENLFLNKAGGWLADYLPAFVRRYPFVFSTQDDGTTFTLCIDESFAGFNQEGRGERLFDDQGKPSRYVENVMKFLQEYQTQFRRTQTFCRKLKELALLEGMQAQITAGSGETRFLTGFLGVNRDRVKKIPAETLAELVRTDELELIYTQLGSLRNFARMRERLAAPAASPAPA
jgi:hypothetical protein